ncbi:MAG TPA: SIR2 family protein [Candidatus Binataceae bacterium]|nr:SIR2 family protein [Candidatus Binataceae bacterium]
MRIRGIDFPEELIDAQRDGELVVFAGAGVSMGAPSSYPSSRVLAEMVGGTAYHIGHSEREDQFLGRLEQAEVPVRRRVNQFLSNSESRPTELHRLLLDLFRDSDQIRLVTTNLDTHFTTAAQEMGVEANFYYAPALPLGHRFSGVVYLHGCVGKDESNFVLTDADFGRAYLTEGWATRFLQGVFQRYSVLFIGYSHDDTVMTYLARGLPPQAKPRFVLTSQTHKDHWSLIKMGVLSYSSENNHIALTVGVRGWVELCSMGALDHERRVQSIVSVPPPPGGEEADYLSRVVDDPATVHFFTRYADSLDWLHWVEGHRVFRHLFSNQHSSSDEKVGSSARHLARWFAANFAVRYVDEALALVRRQGRQLSPPLWDEVAAALARDTARPPGVLARWAAILFPPPSFEQQSSLLEDLLKSCRVAEDNSVALFLFDYLTNVRLKLRDTGGSEERPCAEVELMGVPSNLILAWREIFLPRLDEFAMQLEPIVTNRLRQAYTLLSSAANPVRRPEYATIQQRSVQVDLEESGLGAGVDFLTGAARGLIGWYIRHDPSRARGILANWTDSGVPLLEQVASQQ